MSMSMAGDIRALADLGTLSRVHEIAGRHGIGMIWLLSTDLGKAELVLDTGKKDQQSPIWRASVPMTPGCPRDMGR